MPGISWLRSRGIKNLEWLPDPGHGGGAVLPRDREWLVLASVWGRQEGTCLWWDVISVVTVNTRVLSQLSGVTMPLCYSVGFTYVSRAGVPPSGGWFVCKSTL